MYDYLVAHARKNVWCTPRQDMQMIVKPKRLTRYGGEWNKVEVLWRKHLLPEHGPRFHVYQIGQLHPSLMGLFAVQNAWVSLAQACIDEKLIVDLYANSGVQMPRTQVWYRITEDRDLILAVKQQPSIAIDFNADDLFFRVYSNAYFSTTESDPLNDYIDVQGGVMDSTNTILALQEQYDIAATLPGGVYAFVNGMRVNAISLITTKPGDVAEFVYDSSIYKVLTFTLSDLMSFNSDLDTKHKYLLHYPGTGDRGIDFQDDLDLFVVKPGAGALFSGVYYHRNQPDAVRMVTHKDYSIPVAYVTGYAAQQGNWSDISALQVKMHVRKSGYNRPLVDEHHRIRELYKLSDSDVVQAMVGIDAVVPVWTAAALESSGYVTLMKAKLRDIDRAMVQSAYGYNAIGKLLADTPQKTQPSSGTRIVEVPYGLQGSSTAYEYDSDGLLLDWHSHTAGASYTAHDLSADLVEMVVGRVSNRIDEVYGEATQVLNPLLEYRMYLCPIISGQPNNNFSDVTGSGQYVVLNGTLTWLCNLTNYYPMVRSNASSLGYKLALPMQSGVLKFTLVSEQSRQGFVSNWAMQVPMGELDVFLNKHSLIEGVDYFVHFPEVVIVNKTFLVNPETDDQEIAVRFSGFCNPDLTRTLPSDTGFVQYGLLSRNNRFDIRDDKVMRMIVGGRLYRRSELQFSESDAGVTVPDASNGEPYLIRDLVVPLRGNTVDTTYTLRAVSQVVDKQISDYLTLKIPMPLFETPNAIEQRYALYSPFCSAIIHDLDSGDFNPDKIYQFYSDQDVRSLCVAYEHLLPFDPTQNANAPDDRFVVVHPHDLNTTIGLNVYQYKFLTRVVKLYLNNAVSLSEFVQLSA